jgi:hypothetical protein
MISSYSAAWKEWCAGGNPQGWICDALRFTFVDGSSLFFANKLTQQPTQPLTHEDGNVFVYNQVGFVLSLPPKQINTEYQLDASMQPVANDLLKVIVNLTSGDLLDSVKVEHRTYLLPGNPLSPAIQPASRYYLAQATTAQGALNLSCLPPNLNRKRAGVGYKLEDFAGLARF